VTQARPVSTALLLAAGAGTRLNSGAEAMPKCLVDVGGISILERLLSNFRENGIRRLVIVTGYMENRIRDVANRMAGNIQIEYIENLDYANTNNIYSLWLAREHIREPFLLVESDLVFETSLLHAMLSPDKAAVSKILPWMNGTTARLDSQHRVKSFDLNSLISMADSYKTVNIYCLSLDSWEKVVARLDKHISTGRTSSYYEVVFSELAAENHLQFEAVFFPSNRWYEIDTLLDQQAANHFATCGAN
jgi:NDP-sugar pyrophosphorylase family protein